CVLAAAVACGGGVARGEGGGLDGVGLGRRNGVVQSRGVGGDRGFGGRVLHAHGRGRVAVPFGSRRRGLRLRRRGGLVLFLGGGRLGHGVGPLAAGLA